jgi:predicted acyl esterase
MNDQNINTGQCHEEPLPIMTSIQDMQISISFQIKCGLFLIGGWFDCYHSAVFRMAENLSCEWRAMVGPWPHDFPDDCVPGPNIAYLPECLKFWDYHLKGINNGLDREPRLRLYLQESKRITNEPSAEK